jgi:hypothetical protein
MGRVVPVAPPRCGWPLSPHDRGRLGSFGQIVAGSQDPALKRAMARFLLWPWQRLGGGSERAAIAGDGAAFLASFAPCGRMTPLT